MCGKLICLCLALVLGVASNGYADVIGDWEDTSGDGWIGWLNGQTSIGPLPSTLETVSYAQDTIGHTSGSSSLKVSGITGWTQCLAITLSAAQKADFMANNKFSIDYTVAAGTTGGWNQIYNISLNAPGYGWHDQFTTSPAEHFDFWDGSPQRTETVTFDYTAAKASITPDSGDIQIILALNSSGPEFYFDNARFESSPALTIEKFTVTAGKTQYAGGSDYDDMKDAFEASGTVVLPADLNDINSVEVAITSVTDGEVIYTETIDFSEALVRSGKFNYTHGVLKGHPGAIIYLFLDFNKGTFKIKAKNIDLTGLACPLQLNITIGNYAFSGDVNETIVNGTKKTIPTRLMRMYKDTLVVTKAKVKNSTSALSDSLSVTGEIAVEDINTTQPNLHNIPVVITWSDKDDANNVQTFTIPEGSFVAKTGHSYKCSKINVNPDANSDVNDGIVKATIDLDKCTFAVSIAKANISAVRGDVVFGINFETPNGEFDEEDDYTLP